MSYGREGNGAEGQQDLCFHGIPTIFHDTPRNCYGIHRSFIQTSFHGIPNNLDGRIGKEKIGRRQTDKQGTNKEGESDKHGTNKEVEYEHLRAHQDVK